MWQVRCSGPRFVTVMVRSRGVIGPVVVVAAEAAEGVSAASPPAVNRPVSRTVVARRTVGLLVVEERGGSVGRRAGQRIL